MALLWMEGFDHSGSAAALATKGYVQASMSAFDAGRFGTSKCIRTSSPTSVGMIKVLPSTYTTLVCGFAIQLSTQIVNGDDLFQFRAGATLVCRVSANANGQLQVRNSGGTVIATGTTQLIAGTPWYYVEVKCFVNTGTPASGTVEVHLNGVTEIASTVGNFGSSAMDRVALQNNAGSSIIVRFDDWYICDTSGAAPNNNFLGDVKVVTIYPNADGAHSDWAPNSGTVHNNRVNESAGTYPDDDTTYNSDATVGHVDTYGYGDVDASATVFGVQVNMYARKDDAAVRQIAPVVRQSATDYVGTTVTLASTYAYYPQIYEKDPTGATWTPTTVNAEEFGVKTIA